MRWLVLALLTGLAASSLSAQTPWQVATGTGATAGAGRIALVTSEAGHQFSISPIAGGGAQCRFRLADGSPAALGRDRLPLLAVDGREPLAVLHTPAQTPIEDGWDNEKARTARGRPDDGGDLIELARRSWPGLSLVAMAPSSVSFLCWEPLRGQGSPTSGSLRQILDGERLVVDYQLADGSDGEAVFPLMGARAAVVEALGISALPTPEDLAEDELLDFRVRYRSETCYRFNGRKNQNRCLEEVNRCAQMRHPSVLSMLGCIEGN